MRCIAVVTWFNPSSIHADNIRTFSKQVDRVIVVDDSAISHAHLLEGQSDVVYVPRLRNQGIAAALNVGYERAEALGADWVLTMDQDSSWEPDILNRYIDVVSAHSGDNSVAVFGPDFNGSGAEAGYTNEIELNDVSSLISSGSIVSLEAFDRTGGYNEDLFIDQVDHEFCCRLRAMGYRVVFVGGVSMRHRVGAPTTKKILGVTLTAGGHDAARKYYITRNTLFMRSAHRNPQTPYLRKILYMAIGVALLEDDKLNKLFHMLKGLAHHLRGVKGKLR